MLEVWLIAMPSLVKGVPPLGVYLSSGSLVSRPTSTTRM